MNALMKLSLNSILTLDPNHNRKKSLKYCEKNPTLKENYKIRIWIQNNKL